VNHFLKDILEFFKIDDDVIRWFVYGGTAGVVTGIADEKRKTMYQFLGMAFVGATVSAFFTPAVIDYWQIENEKYKMVVCFAIGLSSMVLVAKLLRIVRKSKLKVGNIEITEKEEGDDTDI